MKRTAKIKSFKRIISTSRVVAVDSMIFSYYFHNTVPFASLSEVIFDSIAQEELQVKTSIISYLENLSYPQLSRDTEKINFIKSFFLTQTELEVVELSIQIADTSAELRRAYQLSTPDAIHLATAKDVNADIFITNDEHFKKVEQKEEIRIIFFNEILKDGNT